MIKRLLLLPALTLLVLISCSGAPEIEEGYLEVNGTTLFYKTMGKGDPIVVLHGGPGFDHRQFLPYIWELASEHQVILYDQRGTGLSSGPVDSLSINIDSFIADIEGIRRAFDLEKINLLGHSWGGILAMHYGIAHPERLRSLILCSTAASAESFTEMRENYEADRLPGDGERLMEIYSSEKFKSDDPRTIEQFWRLYFKPYFADQSLVAGLDLQFTPNTIRYSNQVAGYVLGSIGAFELHEQLQVIECPTLVIHGDADPMPYRYAERIHENIPGSELVIARDAGHWLFVDATDVFRDSILDFLAKQR
jgi:proline iminopeptidase